MKNVWKIFMRDIKNIGSNWVVAVIIGGLIFLPSLYAWFNIEASWDPYSQTDQIPVGVVNDDLGAEIRGEPIHVGDDLMETLKDSDSFDWHFVSYEEAMEKVEYGDFFSVIVVPENFSEKLATVLDKEPQKANVEYFVNEKINAIAPKITEKGASVIVDRVSSDFITTVNKVVFEVLNEFGIGIEKELPEIEKFEDYIFAVEKRLPEVKDILDSSLNDAGEANKLITKAQGMASDAGDTIDQGLTVIYQTDAMLDDGQKRLNDTMPEINQNLNEVQQVVTEINGFMKELNDIEVDYTFKEDLNKKVNKKSKESLEKINTISGLLNIVTTSAEESEESRKKVVNKLKDIKVTLEEKTETPEIKETIHAIDDTLSTIADTAADGVTKAEEAQDKLAHVSEIINEITVLVNDVDKVLDEHEGDAKAFISELQGKTQRVSDRVDNFIIEYRNEIQPQVLEEMDQAKVVLANAGSLLRDLKGSIPEVQTILASTGENIHSGEDLLISVLNEYPYVNSKVTGLADKVRRIQDETDIHEIIEILQNDPEAERDFFVEPVKLNENRVFPIENYGAGMTPFFTVLAIWVGAVLLISLLSVNVIEQDKFTAREVYFGRFLTYLSIGLLQTLIVTVGDVTFIGVPVSSKFWFVVFGLFISAIFVTIVYTTVSVFGDVGKAIVIVMLVLQIAGSGGTYPVVLLPKFFQVISPMLPFTYAIDLMREALGGILWARAIKDIIALSLFAIGFILAGIFLKESFNKRSEKLTEQSKKSGLFG